VLLATPGVGKEPEGIAVELPVVAQILDHLRGDGHHAVLVPLAAAHQQLVLIAADIVHGQPEGFGDAQPAAVDEFDGNAVAAQFDMGEQAADLFAGQHGGQLVVVGGLDLGKHRPVVATEHFEEENPGRGHRLADGFGSPALDHLHMEDVVAELLLGEPGGVAAEMLVDLAHVPVVAQTGEHRISAQGHEFGELVHGRIRVVIPQRVQMQAWLGTDSFVAAALE
jgi:hypothetical protein